MAGALELVYHHIVTLHRDTMSLSVPRTSRDPLLESRDSRGSVDSLDDDVEGNAEGDQTQSRSAVAPSSSLRGLLASFAAGVVLTLFYFFYRRTYGGFYEDHRDHHPGPCLPQALDRDPAMPAASAPRSMVLVSAVSNPSRLVTVHGSLQRFAPSVWDCTICTWNMDVHQLLQRNSSTSEKLSHTGPAVARAAQHLTRRCEIVYRRNYKWASLLNATSHTGASHEFTFVLLDDIQLSNSSFDAERLLDLARRRRMDVLSPLVQGASHAFMNPTTKDQSQLKEHGMQLRLTTVVEVYATLFTSAAWGCFTSMFADEIIHTKSREAVGFGYDFCFNAHCSGRPNIFGRQGLALSQVALHTDKAWTCPSRGCEKHTSATSPGVTARQLAASSEHGRRLKMDNDYNLTEVGMMQALQLQRWVWRHDHKRCANTSPKPKENMRWSAFE